MKINKEDFNKLKQNDRIEYLLRVDRHEKKEPDFFIGFGIFLKTIFIFITTIVLLFILATQFEKGSSEFNTFLNAMVNLMTVARVILVIVFIIVFIDYLIWLVRTIDYIKRGKELQKEFFKTTTEIVKRNN